MVIIMSRIRSRRRGKLSITKELLNELLLLNEFTNIVRVKGNSETDDVIDIIVESDNLPEVPMGEIIPQVTREQLNGYDE